MNCNFRENAEGEKMAERYCGTCHLFPEPAELDKDTWKNHVLPKMGEKLGIAYYNGEYFTNVPDSTSSSGNSLQQVITFSNWQKLVAYYIDRAPQKMAGQERTPIQEFTRRFLVKEAVLEDIYPSASYIKIDPGNRQIYFANADDSLFAVFDASLNQLQKLNTHKVLVDMHFENDLQRPGNRSGVLTNIGILYPNDAKTGTLEAFQLQPSGSLQLTSTITGALPRPVQTQAADMNGDGIMDYIVCGFGNESGALYYIHKDDPAGYKKDILRPLPGAIKTYVEDYNNDGLPDIITLFAQSQEGIFLFLNKGNGNFETKELLRFPAIYGSSYFEMQDMNGDGLKDIIYTCGDNLDYTAHVLKNFHGVYIFLNKGNDRFEQETFFPVHGCYKAMARDFDKDGDMDIASISYFPDLKNQPEEAFVYLENKGGLQFSPSTIKEFNDGNWIVMDAADVDGDGDDDIVIGSMLLNITTASRSIARGKIQKPSFLLLLNDTGSRK